MTDTLRNEILALVARLHTMSHVPAAGGGDGRGSADEDIGGKRPRGGIDRKDDRDPDVPLKSADHFVRRLARAHSDAALTAILQDAQIAVRAWTHTPAPQNPSPEQTPDPRTFRWYCNIADDPRPANVVAKTYSLSVSQVYRTREKYRGITRRAA